MQTFRVPIQAAELQSKYSYLAACHDLVVGANGERLRPDAADASKTNISDPTAPNSPKTKQNKQTARPRTESRTVTMGG
jgi:hypothetical protein